MTVEVEPRRIVEMYCLMFPDYDVGEPEGCLAEKIRGARVLCDETEDGGYWEHGDVVLCAAFLAKELFSHPQCFSIGNTRTAWFVFLDVLETEAGVTVDPEAAGAERVFKQYVYGVTDVYTFTHWVTGVLLPAF